MSALIPVFSVGRPNGPGDVVSESEQEPHSSGQVCDQMYAKDGRPSIPPERLLKASLLIALYSVRSKRAFCEEVEYNLLLRWFLDMDPIEPGFDPTVFTKNRERLLKHDVGQQLFDEVVGRAHARGLLSDEHFTVDETLIEAAASLKSFKPKDGAPPTSSDMGHALMENLHGLLVDFQVTHATGRPSGTWSRSCSTRPRNDASIQ